MPYEPAPYLVEAIEYLDIYPHRVTYHARPKPGHPNVLVLEKPAISADCLCAKCEQARESIIES